MCDVYLTDRGGTMRFLLIPLIILAVFARGCFTPNKKHNAIHRRAVRRNMKELHENIDVYMMK